jgi:hypothetical protein
MHSLPSGDGPHPWWHLVGYPGLIHFSRHPERLWTTYSRSNFALHAFDKALKPEFLHEDLRGQYGFFLGSEFTTGSFSDLFDDISGHGWLLPVICHDQLWPGRQGLSSPRDLEREFPLEITSKDSLVLFT